MSKSHLVGGFILCGTILAITVPLRATPAPTCTDECTNTSTAYQCVGGKVWEFPYVDCNACPGVKGWASCQTPSTGGSCKATEMKMDVTIYDEGVEACSGACQNKDPGGDTAPQVQGLPTKTANPNVIKDITRTTCNP